VPRDLPPQASQTSQASHPGERAADAARDARLFAAALAATVVVAGLRLPWRLAGRGFGTLVLYAGARVLAGPGVLRRDGRPARGRGSVVVGIGLAALMLLLLLGELAQYRLIARHERCLALALTHQDQRQCHLDFERRQQDLLRRHARSAAPA